MIGDPDPADIQRIPSQPFMERKPQARSPDLTHFRPSELSIEWVCHQDRKGGPASTICPESRGSNIAKDMQISVLSLWMLVSWKRERSKLGRSRWPQWKQPDQEPRTSCILQVAASLTTGSLETFHHLFWRAPLPLSSGEHGKLLHTRAMGSIADTSIPQGRGAWTLGLAWYFLLKWFPANYQGFLCSL